MASKDNSLACILKCKILSENWDTKHILQLFIKIDVYFKKYNNLSGKKITGGNGNLAIAIDACLGSLSTSLFVQTRRAENRIGCERDYTSKYFQV